MPSRRENYNYFIGNIEKNALDGLRPDKLVHIEQGVFVPNDPPGAYPVYNMAHYDGVLLSVHFAGEEEGGGAWSTVEGSAVMIAPGIAFTATHVIEPVAEQLLAGRLHILCIGLTTSGMRCWRVRQCVRAIGTDVLILALDYASALPPDGRFVQAVLTTRLPKIGELIMIAGYRATAENVPNADFPYFPFQDGKLSYGVDVLIGVGEVTQHYLGGRGSHAPGPSIEVSCQTPGGLSGGPAFDKNGMLVGILSSSITHIEGGGHSYVALLVHALVQPINPTFLNLYTGPVRLLDLDPQICGIDGRDAINTTTDPATGIIRIEMSNW